MKKLIQGIVEFRKNLSEGSKSLFAKLASGQKPDALFIACSDSRIVPNLVASTSPGELLVLRNIGNLVPPPSSKDTSVLAATEFALFSLDVSDIIICGHSECGAMQRLLQKEDDSSPHLTSWLHYGKTSLNRLKEGFTLNASLSELNQLSQINVLQQMQQIASYPFIHERIEKKQLRVHGLWFDIAQASVYYYEPSLNQFVLIDEKEAQRILERLS